MGGIVTVGGAKIASALNEIAEQKSARKSYRSLVQQADKQAQVLELQAQEETQNLLRSKAQEERERYAQLRQEQSTQKAAFAAAGLDVGSASVRQVLQNQRMQEKLAGLSTDEKYSQALANIRQQTAEQVRALQTKVQHEQQNLQRTKNSWKLGSKLMSFISRG